MPRQRKGVRLWLRKARRTSGELRPATWVILDGSKQIATGCAPGETERAEGCLKDYIDRKYEPSRKERDIDAIPVADVLSIYLDDCGFRQLDLSALAPRIVRLNEFFGGKVLAEINGATCRDYVAL